MSTSALVVIDMQKFFFVENKEIDQQTLAKNCSEIIDISRTAGIPVIHVMTIYREDQVDWPKAWREDDSWCSHLARDTELSNVIDELTVQSDDQVVEKKRFSGFYNTNLDDVLRSLGCDHVYMIGYAGDVCVRFTSVDAYNRGYGVSLVYEGYDSFREPKDHSVEYLRWLIDVECISLHDFRKSVL